MYDTAYTTYQDVPSESFETLYGNTRKQSNVINDINKGKKYMPYFTTQRNILTKDLDLYMQMNDKLMTKKHLNQRSVPFRNI